MALLPKATSPPISKSTNAEKIALVYAGLLTVMIIAQLYTFDNFIELVPTFKLPLGELALYSLAPVIVALELLALPFLLRMKLSPAFRVFSMASGWFVAVLWVLITGWLVLSGSNAEAVGFTGTLFNLSPGWWAVCMALSFAILSTWSTWGMWPVKRS